MTDTPEFPGAAPLPTPPPEQPASATPWAANPSATPLPSVASGPPAPPGGDERKKRRWVLPVVTVMALLLGAAIGYVASIPRQNTLEDENAALQEQVTEAESEADSAAEEQKEKEVCVQAATDAGDYIDQIYNMFEDIDSQMQMDPNSAAYAELEKHLIEQDDQMVRQEIVVQDELAECKDLVD